MKLHERIIQELDGITLFDRERQEYIMQVPLGNPFEIRVKKKSNPICEYGVFPKVLATLDDNENPLIWNQERVDFTYVIGRGLYKQVMTLLSQAVPKGTSYRGDVANPFDQDKILEFMERNVLNSNLKELLENTVFGRVLLQSEFNQVNVFYRRGTENPSQGKQALLNFKHDHENNIFVTSHDRSLYLIGTKPF